MNKEIKEKLQQGLLAMLKSAFQKFFEDWKKCWHKFIISEGVSLKRLGNLLINKYSLKKFENNGYILISPRICMNVSLEHEIKRTRIKTK